MKQYILTLTLNLVLLSQNYTADFLNADFGAKTMASGNAFFMDEGDVAAVRFLSADYVLNNKIKIYNSSSVKFDGLLKQLNFGFSQPLIGGYNIALNWFYSGVTDIPKFEKLSLDESDNSPIQKSPSAFFNNSNHVITLSLGHILDQQIDVGWDYFNLPFRLPVALNINYISTSIGDYSARGFTMDLAMAIKFNLGTLFLQSKGLADFSFFINARNFAGSKLMWDKVKAIDALQSVENAETIKNNFITGFNLKHNIEDSQSYFGFAYNFQNAYKSNHFGFLANYEKLVEVRFGIDNSSFTTGAGVTFEGAEIFISYKPKHELGKSYYMDLSYEF